MKKFFKIFLWIIIGIIFAGTFIYLYYNSKDKVDVYTIEYPSEETIERVSVLTGKIEPRDEIDIKPQISGIISEILVEPGDHVNNGDIIAKIKVIPEEAQLSSAENRVAIAEIRISNAHVSFSIKNMKAGRNMKVTTLPMNAQNANSNRQKTN